MFAETNNLVTTSKFLQHKNIKTTRAYVRADVIGLRKIFDACMYNKSSMNNKNGYTNNLKDIIDNLEKKVL